MRGSGVPSSIYKVQKLIPSSFITCTLTQIISIVITIIFLRFILQTFFLALIPPHKSVFFPSFDTLSFPYQLGFNTSVCPLSEPIGFKKPALSVETEALRFTRRSGRDFGLLCEAQGFPVPSTRYHFIPEFYVKSFKCNEIGEAESLKFCTF